MSRLEAPVMKNPFPGPQPYRTADRARFFGREEIAQRLADRIFVHPALTLYGPSGAGKSSLMAAGVIPLLDKEHGMRVLRIDSWPSSEAPLPWLVRALFGDLELGAVPEGKSARAAFDEAMHLSRMQSDRPILLYLDQLEQLLLPGRDSGPMTEFFDALEGLMNKAGRGLHLVMALREDYLGRLRDRARGRKVLLEQGFRLGPLTVKEMVAAVLAAARKGEPPQQWDEAETRRLMMEVRVTGESASDEAEVQAAFGQIVCRALWAERAEGSRPATSRDAEEILRRYLDETVAKLGSWEAEARVLLEEHLIDKEGNRKPLTEKEARAVLSKQAADEVLQRLEKEAVLRAEEYQGSRYFELGHDWLAKRVFDQRKARREKEEREQKEREREQKEREREQKEREREQKERAARKRLAIIAAVAVAVAVAMSGMVVWALRERTRANHAETIAKKNLHAAEVAQRELAKQAKQHEEELRDLKKRIREASEAGLQKIQREVKLTEEQKPAPIPTLMPTRKLAPKL